MNSEISEIIKDLSEAFFFIVSGIIAIKNYPKKNELKGQKERKGGKPPSLSIIIHYSL